jgi:hypothetical protein
MLSGYPMLVVIISLATLGSRSKELQCLVHPQQEPSHHASRRGSLLDAVKDVAVIHILDAVSTSKKDSTRIT